MGKKSGNNMDRGTTALKSHMDGCTQLEMRQTRRGWLQECFGCEAKTEFKYFIGGNQVFHSLEDASCLARFCLCGNHHFEMVVKEQNTDAEIVTVERPYACGVGSCKCCCYQQAHFSSNKNQLGTLKETCWYCVPAFDVFDHNGNKLYYIHQPTCCGGICVNCCAEGNPCGKGCCKESFRIYAAGAPSGGDDPYLGMILKKPKSLGTELFTDADAFVVDFPKDASADQKGMLIGTGIFINAAFFEGDRDGNDI